MTNPVLGVTDTVMMNSDAGNDNSDIVVDTVSKATSPQCAFLRATWGLALPHAARTRSHSATRSANFNRGDNSYDVAD